jgi:uncharacterized SAM-binding protein YcdF (DUF218 family)
MKGSKLQKKATKILTILLSLFGGLLLFSLILAFTTRPYFTHHWLGTGIDNNCSEPEAIVLFGAGGMPSGENMVRIYYAAEAWKQFPHCSVFICLPGDPTKEKGSLQMMAEELVMRGVASEMIKYIPDGKNTRAQAIDLSNFNHGQLKSACLLVITSPGHMRRSVLSLMKAGFNNVIPLPAFEIPLEGELRFDDQELGGERRFIAPSTGQTLTLRYEFWTQMNYQLICAREFVALAYYWMRGWI